MFTLTITALVSKNDIIASFPAIGLSHNVFKGSKKAMDLSVIRLAMHGHSGIKTSVIVPKADAILSFKKGGTQFPISTRLLAQPVSTSHPIIAGRRDLRRPFDRRFHSNS
jgi:hypothetical protein